MVRKMRGWNGKILRVNLSKGKSVIEEYDGGFAVKYIGGRGFTARILFDELKPGVDPLSPENKLIVAAGPLTGLPGPSLGKLVIAAKSPLTGGYGDGNIGTMAAVQMRKAGFDALIIEGKAEKPIYIYVEDGMGYILSADGIWGKTSLETEKALREVHGRDIGVLVIGPGGENIVRYATVISEGGRSGGRPGMGAVMGSKRVKAIVFKGSRDIPIADPDAYNRLIKEAYEDIRNKDSYDFWIRQGTMAVINWANENSVLPTYNFREGIFEYSDIINGFAMEAAKIKRRGCPYCNMACGNVVLDYEGRESELDYENVAMLGSNIGLGHLGKVSALSRIADELGLDTISLGSTIGLAMEASEKGLIKDNIEWGDFEKVKTLISDIAYRRGDLGNLLAEGVMRVSQKLGGESQDWAMHVKGLEASAYDCHTVPGMALAYATSPIGAHHKDAWIIAWEVKTDRTGYTESKVDKLIELQRIRGGIFESIVACRLPWVELGFSLEWYPKLMKAATGIEMSPEEMLYDVADRIYALIRAFWVREFGQNWSRLMDYPPKRWFKEPLTKGPYKGTTLDQEKFDMLLDMYYEKRGWDKRGIPTSTTLKRLGLRDVAQQLSEVVALTQ